MKIILTEKQIKKIQTQIRESEFEKDMGKMVDLLKQSSSIFSRGSSDNNGVGGKIISSITKLTKDQKLNPTKLDISPLLGNYKITSKFGNRDIGVGSKDHKGIDLAVQSGSDVISPADGKVLEAKDTTPNGCGGFIMIQHSDYTTKYCHLRQWLVNVGDNVKKGQVIGKSGGGKNDPYRGTSTGSHLHYEVVINNTKTSVDPLSVNQGIV